MRVCLHKASGAPSVSGIDSQEDRLDTTIAEMLVDQLRVTKDVNFKVPGINKLGAISGEFQKLISARANIIYLAPDLPLAVRASFDGQ